MLEIVLTALVGSILAGGGVVVVARLALIQWLSGHFVARSDHSGMSARLARERCEDAAERQALAQRHEALREVVLRQGLALTTTMRRTQITDVDEPPLPTRREERC